MGFPVAEDAPLSGRSFLQLKQKFKLYHCLPVFYINEFPKKGFLVKKKVFIAVAVEVEKANYLGQIMTFVFQGFVLIVEVCNITGITEFL